MQTARQLGSKFQSDLILLEKFEMLTQTKTQLTYKELCLLGLCPLRLQALGLQLPADGRPAKG